MDPDTPGRAMTNDRSRSRHNAHQRAHFDTSTLSNPRMAVADTPYVQRHVDRLLSAARIEPGATILDVGCGLGKFTLPLRDRGFEVVGLDLSADLIRSFGQGHETGDIELVVGDIVDPPAKFRNRFDAVVGFFMLHHLLDLRAGFAGVYRCLKPGGTTAFLEPNAYSPLFPIQITLTPAMSWRSDYGVLRMSRGRLLGALEASGFTDRFHEWTGLFPPAIANRVPPSVETTLDRLPLPGPLSSFQVVGGTRPTE